MLERPRHNSSSLRAELKAARGRRYRARTRECRAVALVEFGGGVIDLLIATGWLVECDSADAREIGRAISRLLAASARV